MGRGKDIIQLSSNPDDCVVMFLEVDFRLPKNDIAGFVVVMLDLPAVEKLKEYIDDFLNAI